MHCVASKLRRAAKVGGSKPVDINRIAANPSAAADFYNKIRQKLPFPGSKSDFRFIPESRLNAEFAACPKSARQKQPFPRKRVRRHHCSRDTILAQSGNAEYPLLPQRQEPNRTERETPVAGLEREATRFTLRPKRMASAVLRPNSCGRISS